MSHTVLDPSPSHPTSPVRKVLGLNAVTSGLSGLVATMLPGTIVELFGLRGGDIDLIVRLVGVGLLVFALDVALVARRSSERRLALHAGLVSAADVAWVIATVVVLAAVEMSAAGRLIAVLMGLGVGGLAALQIRLR